MIHLFFRILLLGLLLSPHQALAGNRSGVPQLQPQFPSLHEQAEQYFKTRDQSGHADQAITLYEKILEKNPKDDTALWKYSRSSRWRGDQLSTKKEKLAAYEIAENYAKQSIAINPESVGGHLMLGIAYGRIGETIGVLKSLFLISPIKKEMAQVLRLDPENDVARHVLGILYRKIPGWMGGSTDKSIQLLKEAIQKNPNRTSHYLELTQAYLEIEKYPEAIQSLKTIFKIREPTDRVLAKENESIADALLRKLILIYGE